MCVEKIDVYIIKCYIHLLCTISSDSMYVVQASAVHSLLTCVVIAWILSNPSQWSEVSKPKPDL